MAHEYISAEELKATLEVLGERVNERAAIAVESASRAIDRQCTIDKSYPRRFWLDEEDVERYYSPWDPALLVVHDVVEVTSLRSDHDGDGVFEQVWTAGVDFDLEPLNAVADGKPFTLIRRRRRSSLAFPTLDARSVELVGKFGWPAVPADIVQATRILAGRLFQRDRAPFGVVNLGPEIAGRIAATDPDVQRLIHDFRRGTGLL